MTLHNPEQIIASNPEYSVWVSASAGTGKTKILTDRVLRLLLEDTPIDKILCLTFTNAAASEMTNRITDTLLKWQTDTESLKIVLGRAPTERELQKAKVLFAELNLSPQQLSIHTIHSFSQKILQRFPFEAGLHPGFSVLSDNEAMELIDLVLMDVGDVIAVESHEIHKSIMFLLQNLHENIFLELIKEILDTQIYFKNLFVQFSTVVEYRKFLVAEMDVSEGQEKIIESCLNYYSTVRKSIQYFKNLPDAWLYLDHNKSNFFKTLKCFFLTLGGKPKNRLISTKDASNNPELERHLRNMQSVVFETSQKINILKMIDATIHLFAVARYIITKYNFYKKQKGSLDYDDLIYYTKELLTNSSVKEWVLYKLDGGVDHLLVDEAQDTSPQQWQIIEAIMQEFYVGRSSSKDNRTIFIVGDAKQSIYSFQGADVANFTRFDEYIQQCMADANKNYKNVSLQWSYRSSVAIVDFIKQLLDVCDIGGFSGRDIRCFRENSVGSVEVWPMYYDTKSQHELFWPTIQDMQSEKEASRILAQDIAIYIHNYIKSGRIMPSTGKSVEAGDIMILVRRRNHFMQEVIHALKSLGVGVGGIDRIILTDHLSVQDILSLVKYSLMPADDLNLAALLKSPIFGISESELYDACRKTIVFLRERGALRNAFANYNQINDLLTYFRSLAQSTTISQFLYVVIEILNLRSRLVAVNGSSTNDILDELLNLVMQFESKHSTSLQEFVYWIEKRDIEVKRDPTSQNGVRVMTIHGAKGLEAPIVILPDTTSLPVSRGGILWQDGIMCWLGSSDNINDKYNDLKNAAKAKDIEEYLRLLYVACTRAEDHLIIAGYSKNDTIIEGCFYDIISKVMESLPYKKYEDIKCFGEVISFTSNDNISNLSMLSQNLSAKNAKSLVVAISDYPIHTDDDVYQKANGPLVSRAALSYGEIFHKILEDSVNTKNFTFTPEHPIIVNMPPDERQYILQKITQLFNIPEFIDIIKNTQVKSEVSIGSNFNGVIKIGRIDLLSVSNKEVIIIDYKTDKKYLEYQNDIPKLYIEQLAFYASAIRKIYPYHNVRSKILWVEGLSLMDIDCSDE